MRLWTLGLVVSLWSASAHAQPSVAREHERQMDSGKLSLGFDLSTFFGKHAEAGYAFVQPTALAAFRVREAVLEAALPFAYFHENQDPGSDHDQFALGNPWFALAYLPDCTCGLSRLSVGVGAPVARGHTSRQRMALALARAATGDWDGYLWIDELLPLVLGASTLKEYSWVRFAWDGDVIVGLPGGGRSAEFGVQSAGEAALRFAWHTALGARISAAYYPSMSGDPFQSALSVFLRHARPSGDGFGARFVMNLDGPAGFSFTKSGVWGAGVFYARAL